MVHNITQELLEFFKWHTSGFGRWRPQKNPRFVATTANKLQIPKTMPMFIFRKGQPQQLTFVG
jgi:hypothetical protein